jgi:hypothetical protein
MPPIWISVFRWSLVNIPDWLLPCDRATPVKANWATSIEA